MRHFFDTHTMHDTYNTGFVAHVNNRHSHRIIRQSLGILGRFGEKTCNNAYISHQHKDEGAGLLFSMPWNFFKHEWPIIEKNPHLPWAVGQFFLPRSRPLYDEILILLRQELALAGLRLCEMRTVPTHEHCLLPTIRPIAPRIQQFLVCPLHKHDYFLHGEIWERKLFIARRYVEKGVRQFLRNSGQDVRQFHVASFSSLHIVYKALVPAIRLGEFYPDLHNSLFSARFVIFNKQIRNHMLASWRSIQPMRCISYAGTLPSIQGVRHFWRSLEPLLSSTRLGHDLSHILPIMDNLDDPILACDILCELLTRCGRSLPHALCMLFAKTLPDYADYTQLNHLDPPCDAEHIQAFSALHNMLMPPLARRATMAFTDGQQWLGAMQGGHGAPTMRYILHKDGTLVLAGESGLLDMESRYVQAKGHVGLGRMLMVDLLNNKIMRHESTLKHLVYEHDYRQLAKENLLTPNPTFSHMEPASPKSLAKEGRDPFSQSLIYGYASQQLQTYLLAAIGGEEIPHAPSPYAILLRQDDYNFFSYFHPLSPILQGAAPRRMPNLMTYLGARKNPLNIPQGQEKIWHLKSPILTKSEWEHVQSVEKENMHILDSTFCISSNNFTSLQEGKSLAASLNQLQKKAKHAIEQGAQYLVISDENSMKNPRTCFPIPSLLAVAAVHKFLLEQQMRHKCGIIVCSGDAHMPLHFILLCQAGADAVLPHMVFSAIAHMTSSQVQEQHMLKSYMRSIHKNMQYILHLLGLPALSMLQNGRHFEVIGLQEHCISTYFVNMIWRIGSVDMHELATKICHRQTLPIKKDIPIHTTNHVTHNKNLAILLHKAVKSQSPHSFHVFSLHHEANTASQNLLHMFPLLMPGITSQTSESSIQNTHSENMAEMLQRMFNLPINGLKPEAIECLEKAFTKTLNSTIEGFDKERLQTEKNISLCYEDIFLNPISLTSLCNATEVIISFVGHTTKHTQSVMMDMCLAHEAEQAIFTLRRAHPRVRIVASLPSRMGIGQWAATLVKAGVHTLHIQGCNELMAPPSLERHIFGHALPWELGLHEVQRVLTMYGLRRRVRLRVQGPFFTGKELLKAALLGAEEFCLPLPLLVSLGCKLCYKCGTFSHKSACPQGLWEKNQAPPFRNAQSKAPFQGTWQQTSQFIRFLAEDAIKHMHMLGFTHWDDLVGRTDLLKVDENHAQTHMGVQHLTEAPSTFLGLRHGSPSYAPLVPSPLEMLLKEKLPLLLRRQKVQHTGTVTLADKAVGTYISSELVKMMPEQNLPHHSFLIKLWGSAGQSLGAFLVRGITLKLFGDANDYAGKGLRGGILSICHSPHAPLDQGIHALVGKAALCGALSGEAYIGGSAGEYFALHNQGALAVVEGVGRCACQHMQSGTVVVLGTCQQDIAEDLEGGNVYIYKPNKKLTHAKAKNVDSISKADKDLLRYLLTQHIHYTQSATAAHVLKNWESEHKKFMLIKA